MNTETIDIDLNLNHGEKLTISSEEIMSSRDLEIVEKVLSGVSASIVGREYNLTRERVRQILKKSGVDYTEILKIKRDAKNAEQAEKASQRRHERIFSVSRRNFDKEKNFSNEDIIASLKRVSQEQGREKLSRSIYDKSRGEKDPSTALVTGRFGSWNNAIEAAGLKSFKREREYVSRWTDAEVIDWISRFLNSSENNGGLNAYESWSKQFGKQAPSGSSIRVRRPDMSWSDWKRSALESMGVQQ